jgi:hypothetical protein
LSTYTFKFILLLSVLPFTAAFTFVARHAPEEALAQPADLTVSLQGSLALKSNFHSLSTGRGGSGNTMTRRQNPCQGKNLIPGNATGIAFIRTGQGSESGAKFPMVYCLAPHPNRPPPPRNGMSGHDARVSRQVYNNL